MAKNKQKINYFLRIVSVVAIVAIVVLVTRVNNSNGTSSYVYESKNVVGEAGKFLPKILHKSKSALCYSGSEHFGYTINQDNCVFDCIIENIDLSNGDSSHDGIYVFQKNNVEIRNCNIKGWDKGIYFYGSFDGLIKNNVIDGICKNGICDSDVNGKGIYIRSLDYEQVDNSNIVLENNFVFNNLDGILIASNENRLTGNFVHNNFYGIYTGYYHNTITNNMVSNNHDGIILSHGSNNMLIDNVVDYNVWEGIEIIWGSSNSLINNNVHHNGKAGIRLYVSSNNYLINNIASNNNLGISMESSSYHPGLFSDSNVLTENIGCNNLLYDFECNFKITGTTGDRNKFTNVKSCFSDNNWPVKNVNHNNCQ